ncbi:MAG TPA: phosphotransferase [Microbacteriaceae bacterium]|nr:phosphotransferase [Microbacteriaceae bacterium]
MTIRPSHAEEVVLAGGTTNLGRVARVGNTVRRPRRPTSEATEALLDHLEQVGFAGAPRYLGSDERNREVLTYIPGEAPIEPYPDFAFNDETLVSVARLLREYHDAVSSFDHRGYTWPHPLPVRFRRDLVSHNDPNLDNVIFGGGRAVALIDFDLASPGCAGWDLACAARLWVPFRDPHDAPRGPDRSLARLRLFADAYGASKEQRAEMVEAIVECHRWCYSVVAAAAANDHPAFGPLWSNGGQARAERTGRRLVSLLPDMRAALGLR